MTHARSHRTVLQAKRSASLEEVSIPQLLVLGMSWMLVMAVGLMPLIDGVLGHTPLIITPTAITFAVAIGSGIFLRRRLSWIGLMLHIYGQIAVWLSIFVLSLNVVLLLAART